MQFAGASESAMHGMSLRERRVWEPRCGSSRPGEGEIYSFRVPPVLGGPTELSNVEVSDFVVA